MADRSTRRCRETPGNAGVPATRQDITDGIYESVKAGHGSISSLDWATYPPPGRKNGPDGSSHYIRQPEYLLYIRLVEYGVTGGRSPEAFDVWWRKTCADCGLKKYNVFNSPGCQLAPPLSMFATEVFSKKKITPRKWRPLALPMLEKNQRVVHIPAICTHTNACYIRLSESVIATET